MNPQHSIAVLNGPNLNLLGTRQPEIYGHDTLVDVEQLCAETAARFGLGAWCYQSNHEGELVEAVQRWRAEAVGFVVNAAAYTHTSVALRDALATIDGPLIEVHISNVYAREPFRHHSYLSDIAAGVIAGCGIEGYRFAIEHIASVMASPSPTRHKTSPYSRGAPSW